MARIASKLAVSCLLALTTAQTPPQPLDAPEEIWSVNNAGSPGKGNAVQYSGGHYYIGGKSCSVVVLDMNGAIAGTKAEENERTCANELAFIMADQADSQSLIVQAAVASSDGSSVITAYSYPLFDGDPVWSTPVDNTVISGSPLASSDGQFIYIVHNNAANTVGTFTILNATDGSIYFSSSTNESDNIAYAPPAIALNPTRGPYNDPFGGNLNRNDVVVWFELYDYVKGKLGSNNELTFDGGIHYFQFPIVPVPASNLTVLDGYKFTYVTNSAPALGSDGLAAYISGNGGFIRGWTSTRWFNLAPNIRATVDKQQNNPIPMPNSCALSPDGSKLLVPGPENAPAIFAFDIQVNPSAIAQANAVPLWNMTNPTMIQARIKTAFNGTRVIYIASGNGDVICRDINDGTEIWRLASGGDVTSEFVILDDSIMVYAASNGLAKAVRIGTGGPDVPDSPTGSATPSPAPGSDMTPAPTVDGAGSSVAPSGGSSNLPTFADTSPVTNDSSPSGTVEPTIGEPPVTTDPTASPTTASPTTASPTSDTTTETPVGAPVVAQPPSSASVVSLLFSGVLALLCSFLLF